jgi:hydrogenase maturation protease
MNVIVLGYGNPFRMDDGVGPIGARAIAEWFEKSGHEVTTWIGHQLLPEVVLELEGRDLAVFVDATIEEHPDGFAIYEVLPSVATDGLNLHTCTPGWVKHIAMQMSIAMPKMIMVTISGANFDFGDSLSELCLERLNKALESFKKYFVDNLC